MTPPDYIALMHGEIDGINSPEQSHRLQEYLAGHPAAAEHYQELCQAVQILEGEPSFDPPSHLRQSILDAVEAIPGAGAAFPEPAREAKTEGGRGFWRDLRSKPAYRLAFASGFALGLLLMVVIGTSTSPPDPFDSEYLSGTILREVESGSGRGSEPIVFEQGGMALTVHPYLAGSRVLIRITLVSDEAVTVGIRGDGRIACESFRANPPAPTELIVVGGQLTLTLPGAGEYDVILQLAESTLPELRLWVLDGQTALAEQPILWQRP